MFDLRKTLELASSALGKESIDFALIGGFALGAHGIHRATKDIDLLIDGTKSEIAKKVLLTNGFNLVFASAEVLQFDGPGYLDLLLANRPLSLEMLKQSSETTLSGIKVVSPEGIIGLKIQAYINDQSRRLQDLADIQALMGLSNIDHEKVKKYADLFDEWKTIAELRIKNESQ